MTADCSAGMNTIMRKLALATFLLLGCAHHTAPPNVPVGHGVLTKEQVLNVFMAHGKTMTACYDQHLPKHPGLSGKVVMRLKIDANGRVVEAGAENSTTNDLEFDDCLTATARAFVFPTSADGGTIRFPLFFKFK